jgi:hypothetical protein
MSSPGLGIPELSTYPDNLSFTKFLLSFEDFVASMTFLGEKGWKICDLDQDDRVHMTSPRSGKPVYKNSFLHAVQDRFRLNSLWNDRKARHAEAELEVGYFLAHMLGRPGLIPKPDHTRFGIDFIYAFRGTTKGFMGNAADADVSYCSLSPVVSTSFAMKSPGGMDDKILIIVTAAELAHKGIAVDEGNVMAGYEREIIARVKPADFDKLAHKVIGMEDAAEILRGMGIRLPRIQGMLDPRAHDEILLFQGHMPLVQVHAFVDAAMKKDSVK